MLAKAYELIIGLWSRRHPSSSWMMSTLGTPFTVSLGYCFDYINVYRLEILLIIENMPHYWKSELGIWKELQHWPGILGNNDFSFSFHSFPPFLVYKERVGKSWYFAVQIKVVNLLMCHIFEWENFARVRNGKTWGRSMFD